MAKEKIPNKETIEAMEELENGMGHSCDTIEELFRELNDEHSQDKKEK